MQKQGTIVMFKTARKRHRAVGKVRQPRAESLLQKQVVSYIRTVIMRKFPDAIMIADPLKDAIGGTNAPKIMAHAKSMGLEKSNPDIIIIYQKGGKNGIALELKQKREDVFTKKGELKKKTVYKNGLPTYDHNAQQNSQLTKFRKNGFVAEYAFGFDDAKAQIEQYFFGE